MKRLLGLLISLACSVSAASAGDVKVTVTMTTGPKEDPATWFAANTPKLYAMFKTKGAKDGDEVRGVLIAEDVGDVAEVVDLEDLSHPRPLTRPLRLRKHGP